ncbi:MAG: hypothetical protein WA047_16260 [Phenylobacterium sp.]|uniref:hypothetical protein n=1 Tax=Phenylobacterium sp. TaxID=1871053 RepID=UPI003BB6018F
MPDLPLAPLSWIEPDRRQLYRALRVLTANHFTPWRLATARHAILVDLEIYDDPEQGAGSWKFPGELPLLEELGAALAADVSDNPSIREMAARLRRLLEANGSGPATND